MHNHTPQQTDARLFTSFRDSELGQKTQSKQSWKFTELNSSIPIILNWLCTRRPLSAWVRNSSTHRSPHFTWALHHACSADRCFTPVCVLQGDPALHFHEVGQAPIKGQIKGALKAWHKLATSIFSNTITYFCIFCTKSFQNYPSGIFSPPQG